MSKNDAEKPVTNVPWDQVELLLLSTCSFFLFFPGRRLGYQLQKNSCLMQIRISLGFSPKREIGYLGMCKLELGYLSKLLTGMGTCYRWILLGMVLLCSILAVVAVVSCEFYEADYFSASYDGFGIFKGGDSRGKCASYAETGLTVDSGVRAARFFGVVSCMILSASSLILLPLAMFVLQNGNRREALWHGTKIGLTLSLCSVLMTFSFSASDNVTERCGTRSCSLGVGGGASVANVVLLVGSLALSFSLPSPDSVFRMSRWRSARPASSRRTRLAAYAARILYHQTDEASANAIRSSGKMLRGASGSLGAAIYFTESERGTQTKAKRKGYMVKARVRLGKVKDLKNSTDPSLTFQSLLHKGFDSVSTGYFSSGKEYAVYSYDQVEILNIEKL